MDFVVKNTDGLNVDIDFGYPFEVSKLIKWLEYHDIEFEIKVDNGWHTDSFNYSKYVKRFTFNFKTNEGLLLFLLTWKNREGQNV